MQAWEAGLKGLATYRPNKTLGSVLSVKEEPKAEEVTAVSQTGTGEPSKTLEQIVDEMYAQPFESRPAGSLRGPSPKGSFHTAQGEQKFILTINFLTITRDTPYGKVTIRRPIEFLLTSNFTMSSAWDAATRNISLAARFGVPVTKIIENLREITWDHGTIRYGLRPKDNKMVPMWHSSDVAVLGYVIEEELKKEGYLDENGKMTKPYTLEQPADASTYNLATQAGFSGSQESWLNLLAQIAVNTSVTTKVVQQPAAEAKPAVEAKAPIASTGTRTGKKCSECGSDQMVRRDGCDFCNSCGTPGTCG